MYTVVQISIYQIVDIFIHQVDHETLDHDIILSRFDEHSQETQLTRFIEIWHSFYVTWVAKPLFQD